MIKTVLDLNGNRHETTIDDELAWLAPYFTLAHKLGIPTWRVREIKGYYVALGKMEQQEAATLRDGDQPNKKVTITILKKHQIWARKNGKFEVSHYVEADKSYFFEHTLDSLAHELSHIVHWNHTADRFVLEKKVLYSFSQLARKRGYKGYDRS